MRNVGAILVAIVLLCSACSTSKEARQLKTKVNGTWVLQTITTDGIKGKFTAKVFNEADYTCFIGSTWTLVSSNSYGKYILDGSTKDCNALTRSLTWSIYDPKDEAKQFQFKRMEGKTAMDNGDGFRLKIITLDQTTMQLRSDITYEGHPAGIIYNFTRK